MFKPISSDETTRERLHISWRIRLVYNIEPSPPRTEVESPLGVLGAREGGYVVEWAELMFQWAPVGVSQWLHLKSGSSEQVPMTRAWAAKSTFAVGWAVQPQRMSTSRLNGMMTLTCPKSLLDSLLDSSGLQTNQGGNRQRTRTSRMVKLRSIGILHEREEIMEALPVGRNTHARPECIARTDKEA